MDPIKRLKKEFPNLTRSEQVIADYIMNDPLSVIRLSLTQVARQSKSSNTAIIRLCQKMGYQGFAEFKFSLSRAALSAPYGEEREEESGTSAEYSVAEGKPLNTASVIVSQYISILRQMAENLDMEQIKKVADMCCSARRLAIMGYNRTGFSASQLSYRLSKMGLPNHLVTDQVVMKDYMEILHEGDVNIIFSISTASLSYKEIAQRIRKNGGDVILFTMNAATMIRKYCSEVVVLPQISYRHKMSFLDDQAVFFVFIEILLSEIANVAGGDRPDDEKE